MKIICVDRHHMGVERSLKNCHRHGWYCSLDGWVDMATEALCPLPLVYTIVSDKQYRRLIGQYPELKKAYKHRHYH